MFLLLALLVIVPIVELFVFVQVADWLGALEAVALLLAVSLVGVWIVTVQGVGVIRRMRRDLDARRVPGRPLIDGALLLVAGFLFVIPGFVSDVLGLVLLVPVVRHAVASGLVRRWSRKFSVRRIEYRRPGPYGPSRPGAGPGAAPGSSSGPYPEIDA